MRPIVEETYREVRRELVADGREEEANELGFVVVDIDEEPDAEGLSDVRNIPTVAVRSEGETIASFVGARPKIELRSDIIAALTN